MYALTMEMTEMWKGWIESKQGPEISKADGLCSRGRLE